jgi:RNA polymerase sigma factor (sigma-70 family)
MVQPPDLALPIDSPPLCKELSDQQLVERFVRERSETAFTAVLGRHGPLVLWVCRRLLRQAQDAEDAFQATFLVFVRKAHTLRKPELLANWLYGVAYRTARHARVRAARRRQRERESAVLPPWLATATVRAALALLAGKEMAMGFISASVKGRLIGEEQSPERRQRIQQLQQAIDEALQSD